MCDAVYVNNESINKLFDEFIKLKNAVDDMNSQHKVDIDNAMNFCIQARTEFNDALKAGGILAELSWSDLF